MYTSTERVKNLIKDIKKRWRRRALKQGLALSLFTFVFFAAVFLLLKYRFEIPPFYQTVIIGTGSLFLLAVIIQFVIRPGFQRITEQQIALFIEEKIPEMEDRINSAIELDASSAKRERNIIIDKLIDDATEKSKSIQITTIVDRKKERILSYSSYALFGLFLLCVAAFWDEISVAASEFEVSFAGMAEDKQAFVSIAPGDIEIEKGQDQAIVTKLKLDTYEDVVLHYKSGEDIWKKQAMEKGIDEPVFMYQFLSIQEPIQYYVELNQEQSSTYEISLYEFPKVTKIDLKYEYPSYTGIPDRVEENTGNIRGLKGSKVSVTIETSGSTKTGEMVLENGKPVPLQSVGEGRFRGQITLDEPDLYHVKLTDEQDKNNKFPVEYRIVPVEDEKPIITITDPQRDIRVSPIEEVLVAVNVTDDYGVEDVQMNYSVNGEEEKAINMINNVSKGEESVSSSYLFLLEDFSLEPGDLISYYMEAEDNYHVGDPEATDIYFMEVVPFDMLYTQVFNEASEQQQQQQSGQQQSQVVLSQQQIIAATWKLHRLRNEMEPEEFKESLDALVQAQSNLKNNIEERVNSTAFSMEMVDDETNQKIAEYLRAAVKEMGNALNELENARLKEALSPEQKALNNLLKADALNKEKRIQRSQQRGSQQGSQQSQRDFMTELQDLELQTDRDRYEMQQQRQQEQQDQEIDEALEKIRELARKQKKLQEQSRQAQQEEEDRRLADRLRREQEQLQQEAEDIARQMEQMSRNNQQINQEMQERLQQAQQNMRQAAEQMNRNNIQQAMSQQRQAINNLDRAQQELQMARAENKRDMVENFMDRFQEFKEQETQLARDIENTYNETQQLENRRPAREDIRRLSNKREDMIDNTQSLQNLAQAIQEKTEEANPEIANEMRNFQQAMQREDLENQMDDSQTAIDQGFLTMAKWIEDNIQLSMERLTSQAQNLESEIPLNELEQLNRGIQELRDQLNRFDDVFTQEQRNQEEMQRQAEEQQQDQQMQQNQQQQGQQQQQNQQSQQQQNRQGQQQQGQQQGQRQAQQMQRQQGQGQGQNPEQMTREGGQRQEQTDPNQQSRANAVRFQREIQRTDEILNRLERDFGSDAQVNRSLDATRTSLGQLHNIGILLDEASEEFFKNTVKESMSQIEMNLMKKLENLELEQKLYEARNADVPPEYKKSVEKYFEALSKTKKIKR